jgi:hypothetical protein
MHRRALSLLILLALALSVAGSALARDPRAEQVRLKPSDVALAKRVTVKAGDLGAGWTKKPFPGGDDESIQCPELNADFSKFTITGKARSAFDAGTVQVMSGVEVYKSHADAVGDFRAGAKPQFATCLRRDIERELASSGLPIRITSARVITAPRVGENRIAFRVVARVDTGSAPANVYSDVVAFQRGRSIAAVSFMSAYKPYAGQAKVAAAVAARMR